MRILIDNGHGIHTVNCSPDGRVREGIYCRDIAAEVVNRLNAEGYDATLVTPEDGDTQIGTRIARVNAECKKFGKEQCVLVSIHLDAKGRDGKWYPARGFSARVSLNASEGSKRLASVFSKLADERGLDGNRCKQPYWPQNLGICRDTACPAVLTESAFMDNESDVEFLLSPEGREAIVALHVDAIKKYIDG